MEALELLARPLLLLGRFFLWLAWDLFIHIILWALGWFVWRVLSVGRYPKLGLNEFDEADMFEIILVCGTGLVLFAAANWFVLSVIGAR